MEMYLNDYFFENSYLKFYFYLCDIFFFLNWLCLLKLWIIFIVFLIFIIFYRLFDVMIRNLLILGVIL